MTHHPGDRVFAKIKGFSNWPARINPLPPDVSVPKGKLPVFFYGTYQVSFVPVKNVVSYEKFKEKWGKPKPSPQFMAAMEEIESNPGIYMLGEDPRAEKFLHQFYSFKPLGSVATGRSQFAKCSETREQNRLNVSKNRPYTSFFGKDENRPSSETSSDASSLLSKQNSADTAPVSDDDEEDEEYGPVTGGSPKGHLFPNGGDRSSDVPITVDSSASDLSRLDSHAARKLARKLQRKAEKKALKKAAKREAKRLAKETERAERRARREARRERRRLHRLEKQRILGHSSRAVDVESTEKVPISSIDDSWVLPVPVNHADVSETPSLSLSSAVPYNELIAAELESGNASPNLDRPTSPLRLEDYVDSKESVDESKENTTLPFRECSSSPDLCSPSSDVPCSPKSNESILTGGKRSVSVIKEEGEAPASTMLEEYLPQKRAKIDCLSPAPSSSMLFDNAERTDEYISMPVKEDHSTEHKSPVSVPSDNKPDIGVNHQRKPTGRRRRRLLSSSPEGEVQTPVNAASVNTPVDLSEETVSEQKQSYPEDSLLSSKISENVDIDSVVNSRRTTKKNYSDHSARKSRSGSHSQVSLLSQDGSPSFDPQHSIPPESTEVVAQLCQLCRDLKASLVRGHENFTHAVQHLTQLTTMSIRLPQLAQAWDLMDCIKKCRRYKLSAEVRDAAQKTLRFFQTVQSSATKEEIAQTQTLIAAHHNRLSAPGKPEHILKTKAPTDSVSANCVDLTDRISAFASPPKTPPSDRGLLKSVETTVPTTETLPVVFESLNADLEAKMDDMLSLIRATEERMAASSRPSSKLLNNRAISASNASIDFVPLVHSSVGPTSESAFGTDHHNIRASAVAAAAAHMHDEEDEESVMSRVEQVAAFEAASKITSTITTSIQNSRSLSPPPPPPPPPPPLTASSLRVSAGSANSLSVHSLSPPPVDLDLDSRIELLITGPKQSNSWSQFNKHSLTPPTEPQISRRSLNSSSAHPVLTSDTEHVSIPSDLLARRQVIANKIAAKRASSLTPVKSVQEQVPTTLETETHQAPLPKQPTSNESSAPQDEELYDLLGV